MTDGAPIPVTDQNGAKIREIARKKVERIAEKSCLFDQEKERHFPRFNRTEVELGRVLGRGGFCAVSEVRHIEINPRVQTWRDGARYESEAKDRAIISKNTLSKNGEARFAIKQLSEETRLDAHQYLKGVVDLATELKYLAVINHPHIIKMRAVSDRDAFDNRGFFIVLDRLYDTLERRCFVWRRGKNGINAFMSKVGASKKKDELLVNRLTVSHDLCGALLHMHKQNIIYRDLKPENIGFDLQDNVKIFDLGLATEVHAKDMLEDGTWKLTGLTGSLRYMAPEVVTWQPYNFSADVYSYGILLWQILSLKVPFEGLNIRTHNELVVKKGARPPVKHSWPPSWGGMLQKCWHADLKRRAKLDDIFGLLDIENKRARGMVKGQSISEMTQESFHSVDTLGDESITVHRTEDDEALNRTIRSDMNAIKHLIQT